MAFAQNTKSDILEATARSLEEQGYDVFFDPPPSLLPSKLRDMRPDAIAVGREPKFVIEVAQDRSEDAERVAKLQRLLQDFPDWKLRLIVGLGPQKTDLPQLGFSEISKVVARAEALVPHETQAALLMGWAAFEALGRALMPDVFAKPQSPASVIEKMALEAVITPNEAGFMRSMASKRNTFIHGDLKQSVSTAEVGRFLTILKGLISTPAI